MTNRLLDLGLDALEDADSGGEVVELASGTHDLLNDLDGWDEVVSEHVGHAPVDFEEVRRGAEELLVSGAKVQHPSAGRRKREREEGK